MKNSFDDIIKKKWEEMHFPVDESHREEMVRMLDQNKRRRTGLFWWLGGTAIVITIAVFVSTGLSLKNKPTEEPAIKPGHQKAIQENMAGSNNNFNNTLPENSVKENSAQISSPEAISIKDFSSGKNSNTGKNSNMGDQETEGKKRSVFPSGSDIQKQIADSQENLFARENLISGNDSQTNDVREENSGESTPVNKPLVTSSAGSRESLSSRNSWETELIDALSIDGILNESEINITRVAPQRLTSHPVMFFAEAGIGYVPALKQQFDAGYTIRAGGGIAYKLNDQFQLFVSGGYLMQKDGFDFERTSTVNQATFGSRSSFNTLTPDRLHFVYSQISIHRQIRRHNLSLIGGAQYLYGAQGRIVIQVQDQFLGSTEESEYAWLKLHGMQRWLFSAGAHYGYVLTPRISLSAGMKYHFSSIEVRDAELTQRGFYWNGKFAKLTPSFTVNYLLYETH